MPTRDLRAAASLASRSAIWASSRLDLEQVHGLGAVLVLGPLVLAGHHQARGQMGDAHGGIGLVDVLPARAAGAVGVHAEVLVLDLDVVHLVGHGHDHHGGGGGVHAALGLGGGHPLHPVHAALVLEDAVDAVALHLAHDFLEAARGALAVAETTVSRQPRRSM